MGKPGLVAPLPEAISEAVNREGLSKFGYEKLKRPNGAHPLQMSKYIQHVAGYGRLTMDFLRLPSNK
jgi:hypothetical protein